VAPLRKLLLLIYMHNKNKTTIKTCGTIRTKEGTREAFEHSQQHEEDKEPQSKKRMEA
jgi:hypothetical protein